MGEGGLLQRAQARTRHYQASVGEVRTGLSGEQSILVKTSFEVIFITIITSQGKNSRRECTHRK